MCAVRHDGAAISHVRVAGSLVVLLHEGVIPSGLLLGSFSLLLLGAALPLPQGCGGGGGGCAALGGCQVQVGGGGRSGRVDDGVEFDFICSPPQVGGAAARDASLLALDSAAALAAATIAVAAVAVTTLGVVLPLVGLAGLSAPVHRHLDQL